MEKNIELLALKRNDFHVSIEPLLGAIYRKIEVELPNNKHLNVLKKDEINYKGINQEHHSFDEFNFNFIHSRIAMKLRIFMKQ